MNNNNKIDIEMKTTINKKCVKLQTELENYHFQYVFNRKIERYDTKRNHPKRYKLQHE